LVGQGEGLLTLPRLVEHHQLVVRASGALEFEVQVSVQCAIVWDDIAHGLICRRIDAQGGDPSDRRTIKSRKESTCGDHLCCRFGESGLRQVFLGVMDNRLAEFP
jgi:hypothetical protein